MAAGGAARTNLTDAPGQRLVAVPEACDRAQVAGTRPASRAAAYVGFMDDPSMGRFLLERLADEPRDREIVRLVMNAMVEEQGFPPVVPEESPVTDVGDQVLKLIAATYSDHPDYTKAWAPEAHV